MRFSKGLYWVSFTLVILKMAIYPKWAKHKKQILLN